MTFAAKALPGNVERRYFCSTCQMQFIDLDCHKGVARCPVCASRGFASSTFSNTESNGLIAYSGSHGVGKTYSALDKARNLKIDLPGRTIGLLAENLVDSPYPINQQTTEDSQRWIFSNQMQSELAFMNKYDVVVVDRTVLDAAAYSLVAGFKRLAEAMFVMYQSHCHVYSQIYFKTIRKNDYLVDDGFRDASDRDFQRKVEIALLEYYQEAGTTQIVLM